MLNPSDINDMLQRLWPQDNVKCLEVSETQALAGCDVQEGDYRPGNFIAGPTQFAMADSAVWFLVNGALGRLEPMTVTSELSIRFLRPAKGDKLYARAHLERRGTTSVVATVRVFTHDEAAPTAVAQATYALPQSVR